MDYEKKYKEALEWARKIIYRKERFNLLDVAEIFPELAEEAEDERIRKELLEFIKKRDRCGHDYEYELWIAWLEKQKKN